MRSEPVVKDLILVGGGHSHVLLLRKLGMKPIPGLRITLISPDILTPYSGMLPGVVEGIYTESDIHIDLQPLCQFAGAEFVRARVENFDPYAKRVDLTDRPAIDYDVLSLDIGITPELSVPGAEQYAIPVKPIGEFLNRWRQFQHQVDDVNRISVVGAGAGGVELALAIRQALKGKPIAIDLIAGSEHILPGYPSDIQSRFVEQLRRSDVELHLGAAVSEVTEQGIRNQFGGEIPSDQVFWVTSAASQGWLSRTGLELSPQGFVLVKPTLQSVNFDSVFATGDIAESIVNPRPKAGVFAVRQAPILYHNIHRFLLAKPPKPYRPQKQFLSLISTGNRTAVASKGPFKAQGKWVWHWKHWIDQKFMNQFHRLPNMKTSQPPGLLSQLDDQMRCGGCGSKVSAGLLSDVLRSVGVNPDQMDDAAIFEPTPGRVMLHSVDSFKSFGADRFSLAKIAVQHALSDIYCMGGTPVTALATITVPYGTPAKVRGSLEQLIAGSMDALQEAKVQLVGGHTTEGAELSIGFAVNGEAERQSLMRKSGLGLDQQLILTKPLGTGTLLAADMQYKAKGEWIESAYQMMLQSNKAASEVFASFGVTSCTDITGFGLAGHLLEMLRASNAVAVIQLNSLPILDGAQTCISDLGIRSTLHEGNESACIEVAPFKHARLPLVYDPQTSGGLLAAVAPESVDEVLQSLRDAGCRAATAIGRITALGEPRLFFE